MVGDLNITTNRGENKRYKRYKEILSKGFEELLYTHPVTFFLGRTAIDHALISPKLDEDWTRRARIFPENFESVPMSELLSDHAAVIVTLTEKQTQET